MSAGIYLRVIRERRDMSRAEIAKKIKTSVQTVANIENGDKEPRGSLLFAFIDAIGADVGDVKRLVLERDDEAEAYRLADMRLAAYANQQVNTFAEQVGKQQADTIARRLLADPGFVEAIRRAALSGE